MTTDFGQLARRSPRDGERRIAEIEERLRMVPSQFPESAAPSYSYLRAHQGNLITTLGSTPYYGLKYPSAAVTTVPTVVPTLTAGGCPDGLSPGYLETTPGVFTLVWIGTRIQPGGTGVVNTDIGSASLFSDQPFVSLRSIPVPLVGVPTTLVPVFLPWRIV